MPIPAKDWPSGADFTAMQAQRQSKRNLFVLLLGKHVHSRLALLALAALGIPAGSETLLGNRQLEYCGCEDNIHPVVARSPGG
jgi:hypothetical protein